MGWRGTIFLLALIVVVGAYLWSEEIPEKGFPAAPLSNQQLQEPRKPVEHLVDFDPADVVAVELQHAGETRQTRRDGDHWQGVADPEVINDFLHNFATLGVLTEITADDAELLEFGLRPPRSVLLLRLRAAAAPLMLQIGDRNPATTGVYVRIGEQGRVVLAGALLAWEFEKAFNTLAGT